MQSRLNPKTLIGFHDPINKKQTGMVRRFSAGAILSGDKARMLSPPKHVAVNCIGVFFGVTRATIAEWNFCRENREFVYIDHCYLGGRRVYYRVTNGAVTARDRVRHLGADSRGQRFNRLRIRPRPWQTGGSHILLCLQSELYFELVVGQSRDKWIRQVCREIEKHTDRKIVIRDKPTTIRPGVELEKQLVNCHAVVTWNSTVAVGAMIAGVPAICLDPLNSFREVCPTDLSGIENPKRGMGRIELFRWLADNQWTADEIKSGRCWTAIRNQW